MRGNKKKNTKPELTVRRLLHAMGYRFRLHCRDLPGTPDIIFKSRRQAIFVHGCFWHQHGCVLTGKTPRTRTEYWTPKLRRNVERDQTALGQLDALGYSILLLDDEADDASVLDSERSQKVTPRLITALWSGDPDEAATRNPAMMATYLAYTATPQANFLQATHNPLEPIRKEVESIESAVIRCARGRFAGADQWRGHQNIDVRRIGVGCAIRRT